ncbi:MAG TPA: GDSL-type esterase/lipase family protein, partial [Pirellulaceae bacterium]|nr:GDSL-type esterase/lipase family protein [Pirellulaceae bacterium]
TMILVAVGLFCRGPSGWRAGALAILARLGMFIVALSAIPLSYWFYGVALATTAVWLWSERTKRESLLKHRGKLRLATIVIWLGGALVELPNHFLPRLPTLGNPPIFVIGDSVTAGTGSEKETWPDLLPASVEVHDLSRMGATTSSALREQCEQLPKDGGLVLLEIGGNDLLGDTSATRFELDLDQLLAGAAAPGRTIIMFELPLPPLCNEYGRIQRRLAARHSVRLIPKRIFISVLATNDTTLDSIHLSASGHEQMAAAVWRVIGSAYTAK